MQHATSSARHPVASGKWHTSRSAEALSSAAYQGSRFSDVWRACAADPYDALPDRRLRWSSLRSFVSQGIYHDARRTLTSREDLLPVFDKLVHPAGICLRGTWTIDQETRYSGLFKSGSKGLIIARASDALGESRPGKLRFLGLAGKLYATSDPAHATPLPTGNFFVMENLAGSHTKHYVEARMSSDLWPLTPQPGIISKAHLGALAGPAFSLADRALSPFQPMIRQLYPVAELGETDRDDAVAPAVLRIQALPSSRRIDTSDLRHELDLRHHPDGLRFEISVSDHRSYFIAHGFTRIGEIHFTESVASYSGDHRLHFAHPPYRH